MNYDDEEMNLSSELKKFDNLRSFKFIVLGDTQVGKTYVLEVLTEEIKLKKNPKKTKKTVGCDIHVLYKNDPRPLPQMSSCIVELWEISGDPKYGPYVKVYTQDQRNLIIGIIFMFDMTNLKTLYNIKKHLKNTIDGYFSNLNNMKGHEFYDGSTKKLIKNYKDFGLPLLIIGNKIDLLNPNDRIQKQQQVKKHIEEIFSEKTDGFNIIYLSSTIHKQDAPIPLKESNDNNGIELGSKQDQRQHEFSDLIHFIDNCICGVDDPSKLANEFLIDSHIDLDSNAKYQYYTKKKLADLKSKFMYGVNKINSIISRISRIFAYFIPPKRFEV